MIFETDDGHHLTVCRMLARGQTIIYAKARWLKNVCQACRINSMGRCYIGEDRPWREPEESKILANVVQTRQRRRLRKGKL